MEYRKDKMGIAEFDNIKIDFSDLKWKRFKVVHL